MQASGAVMLDTGRVEFWLPFSITDFLDKEWQLVDCTTQAVRMSFVWQTWKITALSTQMKSWKSKTWTSRISTTIPKVAQQVLHHAWMTITVKKIVLSL